LSALTRKRDHMVPTLTKTFSHLIRSTIQSAKEMRRNLVIRS
jgi:hypothetical protein